MALTQSAWSALTTGRGKFQIWKCTVAHTTGENDAYTLKTPALIDTTKPWTLLISASGTINGEANPLDLWLGFADDFALSGNDTTVAATSGVRYKQILDDALTAYGTVLMIHFDPDLPVADVVAIGSVGSGLKVRIPVAPYYALNLNGTSAFSGSVTTTYYIMQKN
jgi:hypothetical protein